LTAPAKVLPIHAARGERADGRVRAARHDARCVQEGAEGRVFVALEVEHGQTGAEVCVLGAQAVGRATVEAQVAAAEQDPVAGNDAAEFTVDITGTLGGGCAYSPDGRGVDALLALMLLLASIRLLPRPGMRKREVICRD